MECVFFHKGTCYANPPVRILAGKYEPDEETLDKYCVSEAFADCPRFRALLDYLKARRGE